LRDHQPFFVLTALVILLAAPGCASEPKPRPTWLDPSNQAAPESPPLEVAAIGPSDGRPPAAARPTEKRVDEGGPGGRTGQRQDAIYTCPMHPEITSDQPGRCPKCGMKLVPREPAEGKK
jgi:hypothetical protein